MPPPVIKIKGGKIQMDANGTIISDCGCCAVDCPDPCHCCCPILEVTVSGFTGSCSTLNGTFYFYKVASAGEPSYDQCIYRLEGSDIPDAGEIVCSNDGHNGIWVIRFYIGGEVILSGTTRMLRPATESCFPIGVEVTMTAEALTYQPTAALLHMNEYDNETVLLLHCEGSDASTTFADSSKYNAADTPTNAEIDTAQYKIGSASGLFVGTGSVMYADDTQWALGTGDFTFEGWIRANTLPAAGDTVYMISKGGPSANGITLGIARSGGGTLYLDCWINATNYQRAWTPSTATWYHICVERSGSGAGNVRLYVDGVVQGSTISDNSDITNANDCYIGNGSLGGFDGWIDEVRVSSIARYSGAFTPSTTPFYLWIIDSSVNDQPVYLYGDSAIDTAQKKFGAASLRFQENGVAEIGGDAWFNFGGYASPPINYIEGSFTFECWFRLNSLPAESAYMTIFRYGSDNPGITLDCHYNSGTQFRLRVNAVNSYFAYTYVVNTWYHVAVVRHFGVIKLYVDGVSQGVYNIESDFGDSLPTIIGAIVSTTPPPAYSNGFDGWIDEFRISRVPRYLEDFTPSAAAFSTDDLDCEDDTGTLNTSCTPSYPEDQAIEPYDPCPTPGTSYWGCAQKSTSNVCGPKWVVVDISDIANTCDCVHYYINGGGNVCYYISDLVLTGLPASMIIEYLEDSGGDAVYYKLIENGASANIYTDGCEPADYHCDESRLVGNFTTDIEVYITWDGTKFRVTVYLSSFSVGPVPNEPVSGGFVIFDATTNLDECAPPFTVTNGTDIYSCGDIDAPGTKITNSGGTVIVTPYCE